MAKKKAAKSEGATAKAPAAQPKKATAKAPAAQPKKATARRKAGSPAGDSKAKTGAEPRPKAARPAAKSKGKPSSGKSSSDKYADPALRDRLKDEIMRGDKGGKPGQWSARKAQLLASEYKKAGGQYKNDEAHKAEEQKHLDKWTDEDWRTADGKPADREGGTTRYLPAEAWDQLTPAQKRATNAKKRKGSRAGQQFVANTADAKEARKAASEPDATAKPASKTPARKSPRKAAASTPAQGKAEGKAKPRPKAAPKAKPKKGGD